MATTTTKWPRLRRRLGLDGNPLRRRSDLIAAWLPLAAVVAFLALSPLAIGISGTWMRADNATARHVQLQTVTAVVTESAPGPEFSDQGANTWLEWVPAHWTDGGRQHYAYVPVPAGTPAGATVTEYLDSSGHVRMPPMTNAQARDRVLVASVAALAALAVLMAVMALIARRILERRRLASWQTEWLSVGPRWSHHT
jgi:hypothetical protein